MKIGSDKLKGGGATVTYLDEKALERIRELEKRVEELLKDNGVLKDRCRLAEARLRARELAA